MEILPIKTDVYGTMSWYDMTKFTKKLQHKSPSCIILQQTQHMLSI